MNHPFAKHSAGNSTGMTGSNHALNGRVRGLLERLSPRQR